MDGKDSVVELVSVVQVHLAGVAREEQHPPRCYRTVAPVQVAQRLRVARFLSRCTVHLVNDMRSRAVGGCTGTGSAGSEGAPFFPSFILLRGGNSPRCTLRTRSAVAGCVANAIPLQST
jgi:hypothetical protein